MSAHLVRGQSYSLTTGRVTDSSTPVRDAMDRPVRTLAGNDLRALYANVRKVNRNAAR